MSVDNQYPTPVIIDVTHPSNPPREASPSPEGDPPPPRRPILASLCRFIRRYLIAPLPVLLLVVGAALLIAMGAKNVQIGGLLGKLLGKKVTQKAIDIANSIPPERIGSDGSLIPIGKPDSKGMVQAHVVAIEQPGIFSDPKTVKVTPPGADEPIEVAVPDGVDANEVAQVVVIASKVTGVVVKNDSLVKGKEIDELLAKYGR